MIHLWIHPRIYHPTIPFIPPSITIHHQQSSTIINHHHPSSFLSNPKPKLFPLLSPPTPTPPTPPNPPPPHPTHTQPKPTHMPRLMRQVRALAYKNALLKLRNAKVTLAQITFPLFFAFLMFTLGTSSGPTTTPPTLSPPTHTLPPLSSFCAPSTPPPECYNLIVKLPPNQNQHPAANHLVSLILDKASSSSSSSSPPLSALVLPPTADLNALFADNPNYYGGIELHSLDPSSPSLDYEIHTYLYGMRHTELNSKSPDQSSEAAVEGTLSSGYATLQSLLLEAYVEAASNASFALNVRVGSLPEPGSTTPGMGSYYIWPYYWVFVFANMTIFAAVTHVREKESATRTALTQTGMSDTAYWMAALYVDTILLVVASVLFVIALYVFGVVKYAAFFPLFFVVFLFGLSQVVIAIPVSAVMSKTKTASGAMSILLLGSVLLFVIAEQFVINKKATPPALSALFLLVPSVPFGHFVTLLADMERHHVKFSFAHSALSSPHAKSPVSLTASIIWIVVDTLYLLLLGLYLDQVAPATHSPRQPFYFPFTSAYWNPPRAGASMVDSVDGVGDTPAARFSDPSLTASVNVAVSETAALLSTSAETPVTIRNLVKTFTKGGKPFDAVAGVDLHIRRGELLCLLGSNGAGKSTVSSILAGSLAPTSGAVHLGGVPVQSARAAGVRIGVCAQQDRLYDMLSAREHVRLYTQLRGASPESEAETMALLDELGLDAMDKQGTGSYSGGQKRKLSLVLAFVGSPSIVLLDEPSSGLDVGARKSMGEVLQKLKTDRAILLTTHYMPEAEALGNRIAVMLNGQLAITGTTERLKSHFRVGYQLVAELAQGTLESPEAQALISVIQGAIPSAVVTPRTISLDELVFSLPTEDIESFPDLFDTLDLFVSDPDHILQSFAISISTLEQVFLHLVANSGAPSSPSSSSS